MPKDIVPDLLKEIEQMFDLEVGQSKALKKALEALKDRNADYSNANDFAIELGEILSKVLRDKITAGTLPDGKMYYNIAKRIIEPAMIKNHDLIAAYSASVQTVLNKKAGISIAGLKPELHRDRIDGIVNKIVLEPDFEKAKWLLGEPIINFSQSVVDDTIKTNIEFHSKSGMQPKLVRNVVNGCCEYCQNLAGTYTYPNVPKDVYRRHKYCRCTVEYVPQKGGRQNVWTKEWKTLDKNSKIETRKAKAEDVPRVLKKEDIKTSNFKRGSGKNYPIQYIDADHVKFASDKVEHVTVIAGKGVKNAIRESIRLSEFYKQPEERWEKLSGITSIVADGEILKVEIHWYEANGQRESIRVKRVMDNES